MRSGNYYSILSAESLPNDLLESLLDNLLECCESETLSEDALREIIDRHELTSDDTPITLSDYEFFLDACDNERVTEGIIQCLLEYFPNAAGATDEEEWSPLHWACWNKNVTLGIIQLLVEAAPDSVSSVTSDGRTPLYNLCDKRKVDEDNALKILKFLIEKCPEIVRHADDDGNLPIHIAVCTRSPEFCRLLIDAAPDSVLSTSNDGWMPLHVLCNNREVNEKHARQLLKLIITKYPEAARCADTSGELPIHYATAKRSLEFCQELIDAAPDSVRSVNNYGDMPLHSLCGKRVDDEGTALQTMKFLIEKYPEAIQHASNDGNLPIHFASMWRSPEFCRVLIEAYPESERMRNANGDMPFHIACIMNSVATVEYLYSLNPDVILQATTYGMYPIHIAIKTSERDDPGSSVDIVKFLLDCDPIVKLQECNGEPPLPFACRMEYNDSNIEAGIRIIKILFDAHPEVIEDDEVTLDIDDYHHEVQTFINRELVYVRQAKDLRLITTPDDNGQLSLHRALQNNVTLGSIKLLVRGNPQAVQSPDSSGGLPLHIACQHHDSVSVVQYLLGLDEASLDALDRDGNTALHYACRGAKYDTIALLLEKYDAVSVSKRNAENKLPIELLWEKSNAGSDREGVEYTESVFRLLQAYPETIMY